MNQRKANRKLDEAEVKEATKELKKYDKNAEAKLLSGAINNRDKDKYKFDLEY